VQDRATRPGQPSSRSRRRSATIEDVAARAGVSIATVSRVLTKAKVVRPETRQRVLVAVDALGYRPSGPARALARSRTHTLGLIMTDLAQPFYAELTRTVEAAARARGYTVVLANGAGDIQREASYLDLLAERRVDGILVASWGITARHVDWLIDAPVEVVLVSCRAPGVDLPAILSGSRDGARVATEHLIALGHRRLAEVTGPRNSAAAVDRHLGVMDALRAAGILRRDLSVVHCDGDFESGERMGARLLAGRSRPTGVVCYNDLVAAGVLRAAHAAGLEVPRDLSVVGFDDVPLARMVEPALTTVAQPIAEMGAWAVERVVTAIETPDGSSAGPPSAVVEMPCRLVVRSSTAPALP
jgi:LacI family transcriptional regulator